MNSKPQPEPKRRNFMKEAHEAVERRHAEARERDGPDYLETYLPEGIELTEGEKILRERHRTGRAGEWY